MAQHSPAARPGVTTGDIGPKIGYPNMDNGFARFDQVQGLVVGGDVKIGGIKVGTITGLALTPETYEAEVSLAVDRGISLPQDTSARIESEGLLGGQYLSLEPGGAEKTRDCKPENPWAMARHGSPHGLPASPPYRRAMPTG